MAYSRQDNGFFVADRTITLHFNHFFANRGRCNNFCVDKFPKHLWKGTMQRFLNQFWGSRSAPFKVLLALALLVMTSMQFAAYGQNSMDVFQPATSVEVSTGGHSHMNGGHHASKPDTSIDEAAHAAEKHSGKHPSADADCDVHCSPLAAFASGYYQPMAMPKRSFEALLHPVLTSSASDRQARPPKHLI